MKQINECTDGRGCVHLDRKAKDYIRIDACYGHTVCINEAGSFIGCNNYQEKPGIKEELYAAFADAGKISFSPIHSDREPNIDSMKFNEFLKIIDPFLKENK